MTVYSRIRFWEMPCYFCLCCHFDNKHWFFFWWPQSLWWGLIIVTSVTVIMPLLHGGVFLVVCTILHAHTKMYFSRVTILQRVNTMCNHSVKSWLWRWLHCCSFSCRLWADESISNRSGIVLASGTLCLITSNRATGHYSEDQMFLKKENVLFISIVSGYVCMYVCHKQPITIMWACWVNTQWFPDI